MPVMRLYFWRQKIVGIKTKACISYYLRALSFFSFFNVLFENKEERGWVFYRGMKSSRYLVKKKISLDKQLSRRSKPLVVVVLWSKGKVKSRVRILRDTNTLTRPPCWYSSCTKFLWPAAGTFHFLRQKDCRAFSGAGGTVCIPFWLMPWLHF